MSCIAARIGDFRGLRLDRRFSHRHVKSEMPINSRWMRRHSRRQIWLAAAIVMLVVAVAGLSTLAKKAQYFSRTNPIRNISISTKMEVTRAAIVLAGEPLQPVAHIVQPQPPIQATGVEVVAIAPTPRIAVAVSMQHRSPPAPLSQQTRFFKI